jgi:hypothetical protein
MRYYLVMGERGEYSDWYAWPVRIFLDPFEAASYAARCVEYFVANRVAYVDAEWDNPDAARRIRDDGPDPRAIYDWYDEHKYNVLVVDGDD